MADAQRVTRAGSSLSADCNPTMRVSPRPSRGCAVWNRIFLLRTPPGAIAGNLLINQLLGAQLHFIPFGGGASMTLEYDDPPGAAGGLAASGSALLHPRRRTHLAGLPRLCARGDGVDEQARAAGIEHAWLIVAAGSGGTLAGLMAGLTLVDSALRVLGIDVGKLWKGFPDSIARLASEVCSRLGTPHIFTSDRFRSSKVRMSAEGYAVLLKPCIEAVRRLARTEGILLDPVYTGKAFAGLLDLASASNWAAMSRSIFLHTGGVPGVIRI